MSAYIVDDDALDLIVTAVGVMNAAKGKFLRTSDLQVIFEDLRQTNYDSVNFRYSEDERPAPREFQAVQEFSPLNPGHWLQVRESVGNYEYQSCEHHGWATSEAYKLMVNLGEWVDATLEALGWIKTSMRYGLDGEEWLLQSSAAWDWERGKGFPDTSQYTPERLASLRKAMRGMQQ